MSELALDAKDLAERLQEVVLRVRDIRAVLLIDQHGLPLVSTLRAREFEDSLAAFTGAAEGLLERARADFQMGPLHLLRIAGRDRQVFLVPLARQLSLLGVAEPSASAEVVEIHLLALARSVLESIVEARARGEAPPA